MACSSTARRGAPSLPRRPFPHHRRLSPPESPLSAPRRTQGRTVYTCSTDKSICAMDLATGSVAARLENAHKEGINRMCFVSEAVLATGAAARSLPSSDAHARSHARRRALFHTPSVAAPSVEPQTRL